MYSMKMLISLLFCLFAALSAHAATITVLAGDNLETAVTASAAGDTIVLEDGVHRGWNVTPKNDQTFLFASRSSMNGAQVLSSWTQDGARWYASGQTQESATLTGSCSTGYRCTRPEELFIDNVPQDHMLTLAEVVQPGQWFFDYPADRIYTYGDPAGKVVETSIRGQALGGTATNVKIYCRGATIEKYAVPAQRGAIGVGSAAAGDGWKVIGCNVRHIHGVAIFAGDDWEVRDNTLCDNGQLGAAGGGTNALWVNNTICRNNYARFAAGWEAGGTKFTNSTNHRFLRNTVFSNRGPGVWYDVENLLALIEGNEIYDNSHEGIKYEISDTCVIRNNTIRNNGVVFHEWLLVGQIHLQNADGCLIERNAVTVPQGTSVDTNEGPHGIMISCQTRPGSTCNNNIVQDNVIAFTGSRGMVGAGEDVVGDVTGFYTTNIFRRNTYQVLNSTNDHFIWNAGPMTYAEWITATSEVGATLQVIHALP